VLSHCPTGNPIEPEEIFWGLRHFVDSAPGSGEYLGGDVTCIMTGTHPPGGVGVNRLEVSIEHEPEPALLTSSANVVTAHRPLRIHSPYPFMAPDA